MEQIKKPSIDVKLTPLGKLLFSKGINIFDEGFCYWHDEGQAYEENASSKNVQSYIISKKFFNNICTLQQDFSKLQSVSEDEEDYKEIYILEEIETTPNEISLTLAKPAPEIIELTNAEKIKKIRSKIQLFMNIEDTMPSEDEILEYIERIAFIDVQTFKEPITIKSSETIKVKKNNNDQIFICVTTEAGELIDLARINKIFTIT